MSASEVPGKACDRCGAFMAHGIFTNGEHAPTCLNDPAFIKAELVRVMAEDRELEARIEVLRPAAIEYEQLSMRLASVNVGHGTASHLKRLLARALLRRELEDLDNPR